MKEGDWFKYNDGYGIILAPGRALLIDIREKRALSAILIPQSAEVINRKDESIPSEVKIALSAASMVRQFFT